MNGLAFLICQLGLFQFTNRKTGRKDINKLTSRPLLIFYISKLSAKKFFFILSSRLPIVKLNMPKLNNHNQETFIINYVVLMMFLYIHCIFMWICIQMIWIRRGLNVPDLNPWLKLFQKNDQSINVKVYSVSHKKKI